MILFYIDEAGDPYFSHDPLLDGESPLFCLSAIAMESSNWRKLEARLNGLKARYFRDEIVAFEGRHPDQRCEQFEVKGRFLFKPSNAGIRRCHIFAKKALQLCGDLGIRLFTCVWIKNPAHPVDSMAMYTKSLQILSERFHYHCRAQRDSEGLLIVDARTKALDFRVSVSHVSFLLGNATGRAYTSLTEAPMFVDSCLSAGVQLADIIGGCIYGHYYQRRCAGIPGFFDGTHPVSASKYRDNPGRTWTTKTPARDYSHCAQYWPLLNQLQFKRTDVRPPSGVQIVSGYYGFRELGFRDL